MHTLNCKLKNCYGIESFDHEFDFSNTNVFMIYAKNGLMKTSFAKTFKKIQLGKAETVCDEIFGAQGEIKVTIDGKNIEKNQVFVINNFENCYESSSVSSLLVNESIKKSISTLLDLNNDFLKALEQYSGLKVLKVQQGKKTDELKTALTKDMGFNNDSIIFNLDRISTAKNNRYLPNVKYSTIFNESAIKKITNKNFQNKIADFCKATDLIYKEYKFLEKGAFTLPKLKNVAKNLASCNYFVNGNKIILNNDTKLDIHDNKTFESNITNIEDRIKRTPEFNKIRALLYDSKGSDLLDTIDNNPGLLDLLKDENLDNLRIELWTSYIKKAAEPFNKLLDHYRKVKRLINDINISDTTWNHALKIFEDRFTVPYKMTISNMKGSIIGETIPHVKFSFDKPDHKQVILDRSSLEGLDILSQGEKRSLYLLNIIFDIEKIKQENREVLFIIDDIADSFDYKNKYAIVEYLYEMANTSNFKLIILSHNFDFYRTVTSRLDLPRCARLIAKNNGNITLVEEKYQKQPFSAWKNKPDKYSIFALIPFVRNLIEYGSDRKVVDSEYYKSVDDSEYYKSDQELLTSLLHKKDGSECITFGQLYKLFEGYIDNFKPQDIFESDERVIDKLYEMADKINPELDLLEHKVLLSMACRLKAEEIMIEKISSHAGRLTLTHEDPTKCVRSKEFLEYATSHRNMTRSLFNGYKQFSSKDDCKIIDEVNIMTPENIHINSFMYEPIMDIDINELINLYKKLTALSHQ